MKLTLTQVNRYTTKKDGSPLITSKGRPYTSVRIKTQEHGDTMISGFGSESNAHWKAGDTVEADVVQKGEYMNFSMPAVEKVANMEQSARIMNYLTFEVLPKLNYLYEREKARADSEDEAEPIDPDMPRF